MLQQAVGRHDGGVEKCCGVSGGPFENVTKNERRALARREELDCGEERQAGCFGAESLGFRRGSGVVSDVVEIDVAFVVVEECVGEWLEPGQVAGRDPVGGWSDVSFGSATDRFDAKCWWRCDGARRAGWRVLGIVGGPAML